MAGKTTGDDVGGDKITLGNIQADHSAIAVGRGARAEVHYHYKIVEQSEPGVPVPRTGAAATPRAAPGRAAASG